MSDLLLDELRTTPLRQKLNCTETVIVTAIRPHLYVHGSPAGTLRMDIYNAADSTLLASSNSLTITSLKTLAYAHKYYRFDVSWGLVENTIYTIRLVGTGYTFSESAYVGWIKDNGDGDFRKYEATYAGFTEGYNSAFDMEVWNVTDNVRGL
jgi:hypothetical protein